MFIPVVLSSNDSYILGLAATIKSIIYHASKDNCYEINILYTQLSDKNKQKISKMADENISINFVNIVDKLKTIAQNTLYTNNHISEEAYYRLFIPEIFYQYNKILYLDCDLVVKDDIAKLYAEDISNKVLGVVLNPPNKKLKQYREKILGVPEKYYFNSGVLLINTKLFIKRNIKDECFNLLKNRIKTPPCWDQDLLNVTCFGRVKFLDWVWNYQWTPLITPDFFEQSSHYFSVRNSFSSKIFHFTTHNKPWNYFNIYSLYWWFYVIKTSYAKDALVYFVKNAQNTYELKIIEKLFSVKNIDRHRVVTILGVKCKFKRK